MPLNPNIILGVRPVRYEVPDPVEQQTKELQLKSLLNQQKMQEQTMADDQATREAYRAAGGDQSKVLQNLLSGGQYKAYQAERAADLTRQKTTGEINKDKIASLKSANGLIGSAAYGLTQNPTPENAQATLQGLRNQFGPELSAQLGLDKVQIPSDPNAIKQWANQHYMNSIETDKLMADKTSRENNAATNATSRANNAATVGLGYANLAENRRHHGATEGATVGGGKPLPASALKLQQEELDSLGLAKGIQSDLSSLKSQLDSGKLNFGPVSNLVNRGRNAVGLSDEGSRNFASFTSSLEKIRNDSLRLNKGVQTEGDAQRAWNEIIANINDPEVVKQRLDEVMRINDRAANLRKMNIDNIRSNYGKSSLETSGYENQPAVVGANKGQTKAGASVSNW